MDPTNFHQVLPNPPEEVEFFECPGNGKWFYVKLIPNHYTEATAYMTTLKAQDNPSEFNNVSLCYHGTSVSSAIGIIHRGISTGPSFTKNERGIYVEGPKRKWNTMHYATHDFIQIVGGAAGWMAACVMEFFVDQNHTKNVDGQWCVKDPRYLMLTGMYVQLIHYYDLDTKGFRGTYRISRIGLDQAPKRWAYLETLNMEEVYNSSTKSRLCALAQGPIPPCESNFGVEMAKTKTFQGGDSRGHCNS